MKRRRSDGKPGMRSLDDLLAEASRDDVVQRLPGKGKPIDLGGYLYADAESRVANKLLADHHVIPQPLQDRREAGKLAQQADIDTASAVHNRRRLIPRRKVEASLAKAAEIARRLNTQVLLTRTLAPGVQMAPVHMQTRLQHFDDNCPTVEAVPEDLEVRLHRALRATQPPWWKTLWKQPFQ